MVAPVHDIDRLVAAAFRRPAWRVNRPTPGNDPQPALIVEGIGNTYIVESKRSSEGRRDRVIPLLAQAILEAQASVSRFPAKAIPVAVVAAPHIATSVVEAAKDYAEKVAPRTAIGLLDATGLRAFHGHGLEVLNQTPSARDQRQHRRLAAPRLPHLFSGLNQWMLKVLLADSIPPNLLAAPRAPCRNPTELARAAGVSVMSAFRLVRQLEIDRFIAPGDSPLKLLRIPDLLHRWAAWNDPVQEFPVRWLIKRDRTALDAALKAYAATPAQSSPRVCLALFAAADKLGFSFVHGVPPHIYMERFDPALLQKLGFTMEGAEHTPDAWIRIPANPEAVFRAAVTSDGVPCADILQVWLDVAAHPSRGKAQATEIARHALQPLLRKKRGHSPPASPVLRASSPRSIPGSTASSSSAAGHTGSTISTHPPNRPASSRS